ncbi:MAG: MBL fold metallo-hydrolase [bacterium]|nr:MBL fold metallo-hydrolase [bacterium]
MIVKSFIEPPIDNNNYLLIDEESKEAALIDCSSYELADKVKSVLQEYGASLKYILLTHGHFDHIGGIRPEIMSSDKTVQILMNDGDINWVNNVNIYMQMIGVPEITIPNIDKYIKDNEIIMLGNTEIRVIHTPGHTKGGVCYYTDGKLFSGDTIFRESVGRCDLDGGNFDEIVRSIEDKIYLLPNETQIYPGHGRTTTVGWEKEHNSYL